MYKGDTITCVTLLIVNLNPNSFLFADFVPKFSIINTKFVRLKYWVDTSLLLLFIITKCCNTGS